MRYLTSRVSPDPHSVHGLLPSLRVELLARSWTVTIAASFLVSACLYVYYFTLRFNLFTKHSSKSSHRFGLSNQSTDSSCTHLQEAVTSLDSDSDANDEVREQDVGAAKKSGIAALAATRTRIRYKRLVGKDAASTQARKSSIIRITSTDPTSNLSGCPIQLAVQANGRRGYSLLTPLAGSFRPEPLSSPPARKSSPAPSASPSRRRKDSGKPFLLGRSSPIPTHLSSARSSPFVDGAKSHRSRSVDEAPTAAIDSSTCISTTTKKHAKRCKDSTNHASVDDDWTDEIAVVSQEPCSTIPTHTPTTTISSIATASCGSCSTSLVCYGSPRLDAVESDAASLYSHAQSAVKMLSILKTKPQTFRTASLKQIDLSWSLMPKTASLADGNPIPSLSALHPNLDIPSNVSITASRPPASVSSTCSESSSSSSTRPTFPRLSQHKKQIQVVEPDWTPYTDSHERARQRLETAGKVSSLRHGSNAESNVTGGGQDLPTLGDEGHVFAASPVQDTKHEFWFEQFTQSTAAAGRDWDWRKRRARLALAAGLNPALEQSRMTAGTTRSIADENEAKVQVQLERQVTNGKPKTYKLRAAPLISFSQDELLKMPKLTIVIQSVSRNKIPYNLSPQSLSPLGDTLSPSSSPVSPNEAEARKEESKRTASSFKQSVGRMMRRMGSSPDTANPSPALPLSACDSSKPSPTNLAFVQPVGLDVLKAQLSTTEQEAYEPKVNTLNGVGIISTMDAASRQSVLSDPVHRRPPSKRTSTSPGALYSWGGSLAKSPSAPMIPDFARNQDGRPMQSRRRASNLDTIHQGSQPADEADVGSAARIRASLAKEIRGQVESNNVTPLAQILASAPPNNPPVAKTRARGGSRSSILKNAGGAWNEIDPAFQTLGSSTARRRGSIESFFSLGSHNGPRKKTTKKESTPTLGLQPESAPIGITTRARSASLGSNAISCL